MSKLGNHTCSKQAIAEGERERDRVKWREREREKETDRQTERPRDREGDRETQTQREKGSQKCTRNLISSTWTRSTSALYSSYVYMYFGKLACLHHRLPGFASRVPLATSMPLIHPPKWPKQGNCVFQSKAQFPSYQRQEGTKSTHKHGTKT